MFGRQEIKPGNYVFVVQKDGDYNRIVIGRIQSAGGGKVHIVGTYIRPQGLIERIRSGRAGERMVQALSNPDPNNCIFLLIDRVETGRFNEEVDQSSSRVIWINENRYLVLDGWIKENFPEIFGTALSAAGEHERAQARSVLIEKMNSLYERDLKDHVYAVARSAKLL
ncbi:MAG: hypothetical protein MN733_44175 [Nitrososphaera sp.]|nr:hypothetical protein [Nitrososphaera sp.]